ncbi:DUF29 family protein [Duganella sp. FT80W]|uniref:DUF29 family protein n=1 Tax=Duganella guangzhouensis TaxID=2666084 RepID=A0A6I2L1G0_9BURK|nr:DUF29 domain-containing protein [Duganella guangzhouensis]MRW92165.1 DUF29 family protein [Duganella guangzhouensis]
MDDHTNSLYETDALIWTETQIALLRAGKFDQLDVENIISELGYEVRKDKRQVAHRMRGLISHLLKYQYQPQRICKSWTQTIHQHRLKIDAVLKQMPSLRPSLDEYVMDAYPKAVRDAAQETRLPLSIFPRKCPYTTSQVLDEDFFPDENEKAVDP